MLQKSFKSLTSEVVEADHAQLNYTFAKEKTVVKVAMLQNYFYLTLMLVKSKLERLELAGKAFQGKTLYVWSIS